jgi:hypothetical protein
VPSSKISKWRNYSIIICFYIHSISTISSSLIDSIPVKENITSSLWLFSSIQTGVLVPGAQFK